MAAELLGLDIQAPVVVLGLIIGMTYGILAVGLVLIFRTSRIINFAHGEIGAFGAAIFGLIVTQYGVPYWLAFPAALGISAAMGGLTEVVVVRRLRHAPRLMSIIATLGVAQFLLLFSLVIHAQARAGQVFPQPRLLPEFEFGALLVTRAHSAMLTITPLLVAGLVWFLHRSKPGLGIRGAAANPDAARMAGIFASRMSTFAWMIAGGLSAYTAILFLPTRGFVAAESFGPGLLLRALAAGVIARMQSLPKALVAGIGVGVVEQLMLWNNPRGGVVEAMLLGIILAALLLQKRSRSGREEEKGNWTAVIPWPPLPEEFRKVWAIRNMGRIAAAAIVLVGLWLPTVLSNSDSIVLTAIFAFTIVGLSVGVVTGLNGQLTFGQFALAGIGATTSYYVSVTTGNFVASFLMAGLVAACVSVAIGLPALRIRGLMLSVTTLSFALVTQAWLLGQPWMLGEGIDPGRPILGSFPLHTGRRYYVFALGVLLIAFWLSRNIHTGGIRRRLIAVRDNEDNARAFTVHATTVKLQAFMLAGFLAGIGGALYGHSLSQIAARTFPVAASIDVVAMAVLGGIGILAGPLIGAFYIIGVPEFIPLDSAGLAATSAGWLILILYAPGGLAQVVRPVRDRLVDLLARLGGLDPARIRAGREVAGDGPEARPLTGMVGRVAGPQSGTSRPPEPTLLLEAVDLHKAFGGVRAVAGVSLEVLHGETLGLIGPNGAGKTTLFELLSGFTRPDAGRVVFGGQDVSRLGPEDRAQIGIIRSFQDAALFPTMTVLEAVQLAQERVDPTRLMASLAGLSRAERRKEARAREIVGVMGLDPYRNKQIRELSTGTRRIAELACLVALEPKLLLLDEPSSGIAQRETEQLGRVLSDLKDGLALTLLVIEHDMPLIMGLADRILAMDAGTKIAEGTPEEVRAVPRVIESYLGVSEEAIDRSGPVAPEVGSKRHGMRTPVPSGTDSLDEASRMLAQIKGIGPTRQQALLTSFRSLEAVRTASMQELLNVPGIGKTMAEMLQRELGSDGR